MTFTEVFFLLGVFYYILLLYFTTKIPLLLLRGTLSTTHHFTLITLFHFNKFFGKEKHWNKSKQTRGSDCDLATPALRGVVMTPVNGLGPSQTVRLKGHAVESFYTLEGNFFHLTIFIDPALPSLHAVLALELQGKSIFLPHHRLASLDGEHGRGEVVCTGKPRGDGSSSQILIINTLTVMFEVMR